MSKILRKLASLTVMLFSLALLLTGCSDGDNGSNGVNGGEGPAGKDGTDGTTLYKASNKNITFTALTMSNAGGYPSVELFGQ